MPVKNILWTCLCGLLALISCARITAPQGGPKDLTKPTLLRSWPANEELNFAGRTIRLEFDERIQANNYRKELLITPSVQNPFTFITEKNFVTITFENPLEENTTYFLNFRESVQDITEKNKPDNLTLTFSTGPALDTGRVAGTVLAHLTNQPEKNMDVLLYRAADTMVVQKHRPYYVTKTDDKGIFRFQNLREGDYRMYALGDKNNNLIYDGQLERIGYLDTTITITPDSQAVALRTQLIDNKKPFIISRNPFTNLYQVEYNEGLQQVEARLLGTTDTVVAVMADATGKAVHIYPTAKFKEGSVLLQALDSAGTAAVDTVKVAFTGRKAPSKIKGFSVVGGETAIKQTSTIHLEFEEPVVFTGPVPIVIVEDSLERRSLRYPEDITLHFFGKRASIPFTTKAKKSIRIIPDSTMIRGVAGTIFRFEPIDLPITERPNEGNLSGKVTTTYQSYWIELLNDKFQVVETHPPGKTFAFRNLRPGTYTLRVKIDADQNGEWRRADPNLQIPAEPLYFYPEKIAIRANWDIEDIQLTF